MGGFISSFLCNLVGFVYPAYKSFKAIESPEPEDDTQWLTYWTVYAFFAFFESLADVVIFWLPLYYEAKLLFVIYLQVGGASTLYKAYVAPFFKQHQAKIDSTLNSGINEITNDVNAAINKTK